MSCSLRNKCESLYCETCKVGADGRTNYKESEQYQQGRTDAIDEMITKVHTTWLFRGNDAKAYREEIDYIAEKLKEQKK